MNNFKRRAIIAVDLDYFYAQCEEVRNPSIIGKPVVICVYSGRTEDSGAVSTANYVARRMGVKSGIPILFAKRILKNNADSMFLPMDMEYYQTVSERIMDIIRSRGEKFEQASIDEAYLDVTSKDAGDFREAEQIGRNVKQEIFLSEKMICTVGIGQNKLMAKMAVDSKKPDGFTVIAAGNERSFLGSLPVGKLFGIGPKTDEKLRSVSIETVGDLASADQKLLVDLFGKKLGPTLREMANGVDDSPVVERPIEQISRIVTLKRDSQKFNFADVLKPICEDLSKKLVSSSLKCRTIGIIGITTELKTKTRSKTISEPIQSPEVIVKIAGELFDCFFKSQRISAEASISFRRVGIKVSDFAPSKKSAAETLEDFL